MNEVHPAADSLQPLAGEPGIPDVARVTRVEVSKKGLMGIGVVILFLLTGVAVTVQNLASGARKGGDEVSKRVSDRPTAASCITTSPSAASCSALRPPLWRRSTTTCWAWRAHGW